MKKLLSLLLSLCLLIPMIPKASAYATGEPYHFDLSGFLDNEKNCRYVEMMLDYHLRTNTAVQETLQEGYTAMFLFEGCSDNMDHPDLSDISYYRVSAVCIAIKLDQDGEPYISYFNENCSTLPDRPLEYGAWYFEDTGVVGPATICDGTYELYSVRHGGSYEALQVRTSYADGSIDAVYMNPDGYVFTRATEINIHTRNVNHTIKGAMWSAGCILVGDGDFAQFTELMASTYYSIYDRFDLDKRVGTLTINRQYLKEKMYELYQERDAVDRITASSRQELPEGYVKRCTREEDYEEAKSMHTITETSLMTLPCSNITDARSVVLKSLPRGEQLQIQSSVRNPLGNLWYALEYEGETCYIYSGDVEEVPPGNWFERFWDTIFG